MTHQLESTDILDVQQYLHEIESRDVAVPEEVWKLFWHIYENRTDGDAYGRVVGWMAGV